MGITKKRRAQEIEFRAAGMTLAQVKRSTGRSAGGNGGLMVATVALFALAAGAGGYLAFGQSDGSVETASDAPLALQGTAPNSDTPTAIVQAQPVLEETVINAAPNPEVAVVGVTPAPVLVEPVQPEAVQPEAAPIEVAEGVAEIPPAPPVFEATPIDCVQDLDAIAANLAVPFSPYATEATPATLGPLFDLAGQLTSCDGAYLVVAGHADPSGDETQNLLLSWQRAEFVIAALQNAGFDPDRFEAIGFGSRRPLSEGAAGADDTLNRRVDFVVRAAQP